MNHRNFVTSLLSAPLLPALLPGCVAPAPAAETETTEIVLDVAEEIVRPLTDEDVVYFPAHPNSYVARALRKLSLDEQRNQAAPRSF